MNIDTKPHSITPQPKATHIPFQDTNHHIYTVPRPAMLKDDCIIGRICSPTEVGKEVITMSKRKSSGLKNATSATGNKSGKGRANNPPKPKTPPKPK